VKERDLQMAVLQVARLYGWLAYHTFDSRRSAPGFPDLVLVRPPRLVFAELKGEHGQLSRHQVTWLSALEQVPGVQVETWAPRDWDLGTVVRELQ